jgi:hypothetical protein
MRVAYIPVSERQWLNHFQKGGGFAGTPYQRGAGLGSVFRTLFRAILPIAKSAGKAVGRRMLKSGADVATDILSGHNLKKSVKSRGKQAVAHLLQDAATKMKGGRIGIKGRRKRKSAIRKKQIGGKRRRKKAPKKQKKKKRSKKAITTSIGTFYS